MTREKFNSGWSHREKVTAFQELGGASGAEWREVTLPHDAVIGLARSADVPHGETNGYFPGGAFEYRRTFTPSAADAGSIVQLQFDGVYRDARVYVNGAHVGQHTNGYSRFDVRIDPYLNFGADNEIRVDCRTHLDSRWYAGAGIYRDVILVTKAPQHIALDGITVVTAEADSEIAVVEVATKVRNDGGSTRTLTLTTRLVDTPDVRTETTPITLLPGTEGVVRQRLYVTEPKLWNVDSPHLYTAELELSEEGTVLDCEQQRFGIRTLRLDPDNGLRINDEPVKLRGACIHSDNGPLGAVSTRSAEKRRVRKLKAAGFNAIRSAHNQTSAALLDACDELGLLVMDETFDMWTSAKADFDYSFDFANEWEKDVASMVARAINRPSVIFYSIGNEIPEAGNRFGAVWSRRLAEKVRELDPTRFVTNGINGFVATMDTILPMMQERRQQTAEGGGVNEMMTGFGDMMGHIQASPMVSAATEEAFSVLDVAGMNYADSRYEMDKELYPSRLIIGSETWPEKIDRNWELVMANSHILGDFTWTGWDYLGETGIGRVQYEGQGSTGSFSSSYPGLTAWCGDIDITGFRRPVSFWRETVFGLRSEPYIAVLRPEHHGKAVAVSTPWAWSDSLDSWSWPGYEGRPIRIEVYSDADEIELLLNGERLAHAAVGTEKSFRADFDVTYQPGELTVVAYTRGRVTGRSTLKTAGNDRRIELEVEPETVTNELADLIYVNIALGDGNGSVHNTLDRSVTVRVDGCAELVALGSANPVTEETFASDTHASFDGRALAILRATGSGEATITAEADGFASASATLRTA